MATFSGGDVNAAANGDQGVQGSYYVNISGLPSFDKQDEPPPETTVAMVFQGTAKTSMRAPTPAQTVAPSKEVARRVPRRHL